ncbi:RNA polymerase sigma-70 factor, ECF subfamily [Chitinophaga costaii]|uniref:RNA polymerase sigma-70 factor, ECF subfamily n=1 Tax=Chitinophaga costaii TaxID=1335309 RepID=A0A1C3ZG64_9BACT|nr:RNA polymerase sigma-70 factor [Chitinophaga costaii]PUZ30357.1 RNA polymerase sigma-70 factor [Chitinophaga costaii]SCB81308.1 RNA polymerase sigma-70 factor, ECF subfamily [Chitinophaga costaii]
MYQQYDDRQLLALLRKHNVHAFNAIYDRYSQPLFLYICSKTDTGEAGKDILQDIFTYLWENRATIEVTQQLKAYLYQCARHKIIDLYRKDDTYRRYLQQLIEHFDTQPHLISDRLDHKVKAQRVLEGINHLPDRMKEAFMLSRFEHRSIEEIAARMDLSQQTVKNQISKALKILRERYAQTDLLLWLLLLHFLQH